MTFACPSEWNLTPQQAKLFCAVFEATTVISKEAVQDRIAPYRQPKIVDVVLFHVRKKLRPFNVKIEAFWGEGLRIDDAVKDQLRAGAVSIQEIERAA